MEKILIHFAISTSKTQQKPEIVLYIPDPTLPPAPSISTYTYIHNT